MVALFGEALHSRAAAGELSGWAHHAVPAPDDEELENVEIGVTTMMTTVCVCVRVCACVCGERER